MSEKETLIVNVSEVIESMLPIDSVNNDHQSSNSYLPLASKLLMNLTRSDSVSSSSPSLLSSSVSSVSNVSHELLSGITMDDSHDESFTDYDLQLHNKSSPLLASPFAPSASSPSSPVVSSSSTFLINLFNFSNVTSSTTSPSSTIPFDYNSSVNTFLTVFNQSLIINYSDTNITSLSTLNLPLYPISSSPVPLMSTSVTSDNVNGICAPHHDITSLDLSSIQYPGNHSRFLDSQYSHIEYIKISFTIAVILAALAGNIGIILAISLHRSLRTTINYYLVNLAVADLFICTFCMSVYLINNLTEPLFILGPIVCKLNAFCQMTCLTSSVLTLSAISCDRFIAILYPLQARFRVTKHRTGILIVLIWITSAIVSLPFLFMRRLYIIQWLDFTEITCGESWPVELTYDPIKKSCIASHPTKKIYYTMVTIALFFVPITVMFTAYMCVVWKLWANVLPGEPNIANMNHQDQARKKVIKMVCIMLIAFIVCWVPLQVVVLYSQFSHSSDQGELPSWFNRASYIATFIAYCNSALNPIIYGGFNQSFRDALYNIFTCKCQRDTFYRPPSREKWNRQALRSNQTNGISSDSSSVTNSKPSSRLASRKTMVTCNYSCPRAIVTDCVDKQSTIKSLDLTLTPRNIDTGENNNETTVNKIQCKTDENGEATYYFTSQV